MDLNAEVEKWIGDVFDRGVKAGLSFAEAILVASQEAGLEIQRAIDAIRDLRDNHRAP